MNLTTNEALGRQNRGRDSQPRNDCISRVADFGRVIGASAIFYYHAGITTHLKFSEWGEFAVAFFILLSGVAYVGFSSIKPDSLSSYWKYFLSRVRTVFPIFIIINFGIFVSSFLYPSALGRPFTFTEFLLSSTGISQYCNHRYLSTVMWFIPFIMQAYLLFPVIDYLAGQISALFVTVIAFIVSLSLIALVFSIYPDRAEQICRNWSVIFRLPEVCSGVILGSYIFRGRCCDALSALGMFASVSVSLKIVVAPHLQSAGYILSLPGNGFIVIVGILGVATITEVLFRGSRLGGLPRLFGEASFPFYLGHGVAMSFIHHRFGSSPTAWGLYFILCWSLAFRFTAFFQVVRKRRRKC